MLIHVVMALCVLVQPHVVADQGDGEGTGEDLSADDLKTFDEVFSTDAPLLDALGSSSSPFRPASAAELETFLSSRPRNASFILALEEQLRAADVTLTKCDQINNQRGSAVFQELNRFRCVVLWNQRWYNIALKYVMQPQPITVLQGKYENAVRRNDSSAAAMLQYSLLHVLSVESDVIADLRLQCQNDGVNVNQECEAACGEALSTRTKIRESLLSVSQLLRSFRRCPFGDQSLCSGILNFRLSELNYNASNVRAQLLHVLESSYVGPVSDGTEVLLGMERNLSDVLRKLSGCGVLQACHDAGTLQLRGAAMQVMMRLPIEACAQN